MEPLLGSMGEAERAHLARAERRLATLDFHPRPVRMRHVRILYAAQTGVAPPTFVLFTNIATKLHFSYERYLENRLREQFGFFGSPIRVHVRRRGRAREAGSAS